MEHMRSGARSSLAALIVGLGGFYPLLILSGTWGWPTLVSAGISLLAAVTMVGVKPALLDLDEWRAERQEWREVRDERRRQRAARHARRRDGVR